MIRQEGKKELAALCLSPKGNKYGHSDSIIRSSRIVCGAYAFAPYIGGFAPRPLLPHLSPVGAICGAYSIRPYKRGCAPRPHPPRLSPAGAICGAYAIRPYSLPEKKAAPTYIFRRIKEGKGEKRRQNRSLCLIPLINGSFFSSLDRRKEDKRRSRPLPRPGKMGRMCLIGRTHELFKRRYFSPRPFFYLPF